MVEQEILYPLLLCLKSDMFVLGNSNVAFKLVKIPKPIIKQALIREFSDKKGFLEKELKARTGLKSNQV